MAVINQPTEQPTGGVLMSPTLADISNPDLASTDSITAHAGGTQAGGLLLSSAVNRITTVTTAGDSVLLPPAVAGLIVCVVNSGANPCGIYGSGTDTVNDAATATGIVQMQNSIEFYICTTSGPAGKWYVDIGLGYNGGLVTESFTPSITAFSTGGQTSAVALTTMTNRISVVAAQGDSVKLPPSAVGLQITVINRGAQPCQVFGSGADTINGIATATGIAQGINTTATYICDVSGNWEVPISALYSQTPLALTTNGAIPPHVPHTYAITKAGVYAGTLAAPTAGTDDGLLLTFTSNTANAHTITATGLMQTGTATVNLATFAAFAGASITFMAYQGKWNVLSLNAVVLTEHFTPAQTLPRHQHTQESTAWPTKPQLRQLPP